MRIHHIHWQRLIWFKCKHYGFQFRIEVILWSSWWLKTPTHFFKYAVFKYSASSAHLWSCSEHGMVFWTQRKTAKMSYLYILQKGYRNWFRSIFPMLLGRQSTCLLHQSLHHGFGFQSSFLERNPKVVLDGKEIPWAATSVESPWVATTKTGKSWQILSHELRFGWFFSDWQWWQGWGENPAKREGTLWSVLAFLHQVLKLYLHLLEEATPSGRKDSDGKRFQWFQVSTLSGTFIAVFFFDTSSFICFCSACNNKYSQLLGQSYVCPP